MGVCKRFRRSHCAKIRIHDFRRAGLSADDSRIAVLNTTFGLNKGSLRHTDGFRTGLTVDKTRSSDFIHLYSPLLQTVCQ